MPGSADRWHSFHLSLSRRGDEILLDATHSDDQADGSINFIASDGALKAYFGQYFHQFDTSLLANHGLLAGIDDVLLRSGSILNPGVAGRSGLPGAHFHQAEERGPRRAGPGH